MKVCCRAWFTRVTIPPYQLCLLQRPLGSGLWATAVPSEYESAETVTLSQDSGSSLLYLLPFVYSFALMTHDLSGARIQVQRLTGENSTYVAIKKLSFMLSEDVPVWQLQVTLAPASNPSPCSVTKPKECIDLPGCTLVQSYLGLLL